MDLIREARKANFEDVVSLLERQHETKYDAVVPSTHLEYQAGQLIVAEGTTRIDEEGVGVAPAEFTPTDQFEEHLAGRLDIPRQYLRKMREDAAEYPMSIVLLDHNVNHWMQRSERNWFVRGFKDPSFADEVGIARAFLSDRYNVIDHLDAVFAVLDGVRHAGVDVKIGSADLSERRLRVKIDAPWVRAMAPKFLERYRSPDTGEGGSPVISAGLVISNSETGGAAFQIAPQITVLVCQNGMTRTQDALRKVHLGEKMDQGAINWSEQTKRQSIDLIRSQATDAVRSFLSQDYLDNVARQLDEQGSHMLEHPMEAVDNVGKKLRYTENERKDIMELFVRSGDTRAGGVVNAFTAYARDVENPDRAAEIEEQSFEILDLAAKQ